MTTLQKILILTAAAILAAVCGLYGRSAVADPKTKGEF